MAVNGPYYCNACGKTIHLRRTTLCCQCSYVSVADAADEEEIPEHWPYLDIIEYAKELQGE